jgi:hypothetical protein
MPISWKTKNRGKLKEIRGQAGRDTAQLGYRLTHGTFYTGKRALLGVSQGAYFGARLGRHLIPGGGAGVQITRALITKTMITVNSPVEGAGAILRTVFIVALWAAKRLFNLYKQSQQINSSKRITIAQLKQLAKPKQQDQTQIKQANQKNVVRIKSQPQKARKPSQGLKRKSPLEL